MKASLRSEDPSAIYHRQREQSTQREEVKINNQENFLELKDRNFQIERATGDLAKGTRINPHKGHFHKQSEHWEQKESPKNCQQENDQVSCHRSRVTVTLHLATALGDGARFKSRREVHNSELSHYNVTLM